MSNLEGGQPFEHTPLNPKRRLNAQSNPSMASLSDAGDSGSFVGSLNNTGDENLDFFAVIADEMNKVNNFYIGKLAQLRISLEDILTERKNAYRSHHTSADASYLLRLRDIYVDLAALRSFCDLNKTGFYKIIKKYDKILQESTLEGWMKTIECQSFAHAAEPVTLMDTVTSLVSRDKLIEWERFATEQQSLKSAMDDIFPAVRLPNLAISLLVFVVLLSMPSVIPYDPAASRCLSLTVFVVMLWITEAIPYFATGLLVPILVVLMQVLKYNNYTTSSSTSSSSTTSSNGLMSNEDAAQFVIDHLFNHTTVLLLGMPCFLPPLYFYCHFVCILYDRFISIETVLMLMLC